MKTISILILSFLLTDIFAQENRQIKNDPEAKVLLDKASEKYHTGSTISISFSLKVDSNEDDIHESVEGSVYLKDEKYKVTTEEMSIICDNVKRYVYLKESNELQINYFEPDEDEIESPSDLFDIYKKNYFYRIVGKKTVGKKILAVIELIPGSIRDSPYKKIHLFIDEKNDLIEEAVVYSKDGLQYTYNIKEMKQGVKIDDGEFSFDASKYPGIYIDDMTE